MTGDGLCIRDPTSNNFFASVPVTGVCIFSEREHIRQGMSYRLSEASGAVKAKLSLLVSHPVCLIPRVSYDAHRLQLGRKAAAGLCCQAPEIIKTPTVSLDN